MPEPLHATGFIFGKFYPPHLGHHELIEFARSRCERLVVLICCSNRETIAPEARRGWLASYADAARVELRIVEYDETEYPNTSAASRAVSRRWAGLFKAQVPEATLLVTSEAYGDYVAQYMGITHLASAPPRVTGGVSATALRKDLLGHWHWLLPGARRWFQKTIVISGTESTGKSTLARRLAHEFGSALVEEVGRELVPDSNSYSTEQLCEIALRHARNITAAQAADVPVVIVDTDVYVTQSYAHFAYGRYLDLPPEIYASNRADLRLYLRADAPFHQDGTRMHEDARNALDRSHRQALQYFHQQCVELAGSHAAREERAARAVRKLFDLRWREE